MSRMPQGSVLTLDNLKDFVDVDEETDCWNWKYALDVNGYARKRVGGRVRYVHRLVWELQYGAIFPDAEICHLCENPSCVNPTHVLSVSRSTNIKMAVKSGRVVPPSLGRRSEDHPMAKLTEGAVREIKQVLREGQSVKRVAKAYGVGTMVVFRIKRGETWRDVD